MTAVFADTSFYIALLSANDAFHNTAVRWAGDYDGIALTTEYVLVEIANHYCVKNRRNVFNELLTLLKEDENSVVTPSSTELFSQGAAFYSQRPDKDWSLTDCISFVVMRQHGITEALTCDQHFVQAGFRRLL